MPESAIASAVDFILPPEGIAMEIARIARAQPGPGAKPSPKSAFSPATGGLRLHAAEP
jgi:hypothetical protein